MTTKKINSSLIITYIILKIHTYTHYIHFHTQKIETNIERKNVYVISVFSVFPRQHFLTEKVYFYLMPFLLSQIFSFNFTSLGRFSERGRPMEI